MGNPIHTLLEDAGIDAVADEGPAGATGVIYTLEAPDRARRDSWWQALARRHADSGLWPVVLAEEMSLTPRGWSRHGHVLPLASLARFAEILEAAGRELAALDGWRREPEEQRGPNRVKALLGWRDGHPAGAPLSSLMAAIREAPVEPMAQPPPVAPPPDHGETDGPAAMAEDLTLALFPVRRGCEVLAVVDFGNFNGCPPAPYHVARAARWERDLAARLCFLGADSHGFVVGAPPRDEDQHVRLWTEQLGDERPPPGALRRLHHWRFWWD